MANAQELNRYSYVGNNPMKRTDPTGHFMIELKLQYQYGMGGYGGGARFPRVPSNRFATKPAASPPPASPGGSGSPVGKAFRAAVRAVTSPTSVYAAGEGSLAAMQADTSLDAAVEFGKAYVSLDAGTKVAGKAAPWLTKRLGEGWGSVTGLFVEAGSSRVRVGILQRIIQRIRIPN